MKKILISALIFSLMPATGLFAQRSGQSAQYGNTLNMGLGAVNSGYAGHPVLAVHADYEFDVVKNFTLAPSVSFYTYGNSYYWGNKNYPYRYYNYHATAIPIGVKGAYYFDQLFKAGAKWDFYAAATLGVAIVQSRWEDGYYGERDAYRHSHRSSSPLFADVHAGAEFHMNDKFGLILDLSTGISTFGLGIHF